MAEMLDEAGSIESTTVGVFRTAATVKGGRRFSFSSLVVVGDRNGRVGVGYGKANQVPPAIEKAQKEGKRRMRDYPLTGRTIPHAVTGRFGACQVRLLPASPGTGVIASAAVRAPLEMMGIQDCLTKSYGSNNSKNLVKAVIDGLDQLRAKSEVEALRGMALGTTEVEEAIERGEAFLKAGADAAAPAKELELPPSAKKKEEPKDEPAKEPEAEPEKSAEATTEEPEKQPPAEAKPEATPESSDESGSSADAEKPAE